jgi:Leucine-rich repeat (LRR) protein
LEELHLSRNQYEKIELGDEHHADEGENCSHEVVRKLHFNGNPIGCWEEVVKLGRAFPTLESLVLAECPLKELQQSHVDHFPELRFLNLSNTLISTWEDIDHLRLFPELGSLRIMTCPLLEVGFIYCVL